ncbi:MAG TPA: hypothetical protein VK810_00530, partial [Dongiaceae bacterium]|nr:hypothetical protein [Dongiaceae bacterium]
TLAFLAKQQQAFTVAEIAKGVGADEDIESIFKICEHLSSNPNHKIQKTIGNTPLNSHYASS